MTPNKDLTNGNFRKPEEGLRSHFYGPMKRAKYWFSQEVLFFFFFNENGFHLEVRDAICLILVLDCGVLYYFVCAKSL